MLLLLTFTLVSLNPPSCGIVADRCEVIELNRMAEAPAVDWDANPSKPQAGRWVLSQWILWEPSPDENVPGQVVRAWKLARPDQHVTRTPSGEYLLMLDDGPALRQIVAPVFRQSVTLHDPELENRALWPTEKRRPLTSATRRVLVPEPTR